MIEQVHVGIYRGDMFIDMEGSVQASMKKCLYKTCLAFSVNDLLAYQCNFPSGAQGNDRHACVKKKKKAYQLALLLYDGLAYNLLMELHV